MGVLFVCRGNVARSQMAEAFYAKLYGSDRVMSAGTMAKGYSKYTLGEISSLVVSCMGELGYDLSNNKPKQLTPEMVEGADRVIVMAERYTWPDFLASSGKIQDWLDVPDPRGGSYGSYKHVRDQIKRRIEAMRTL